MIVYVVVARGFMCSDWVYVVFRERSDAVVFIAEEKAKDGLTFAIEEFALR